MRPCPRASRDRDLTGKALSSEAIVPACSMERPDLGGVCRRATRAGKGAPLDANGAGRDGATRSSGGRIPPEAVAALREMAAALVGAPAEEIKELTVSGVGVGVGAV